ncbi:MAG: type II toxin-antitoxin system YoeB family toxin [Spirochaetes bacterium]|nr:type II toxin-antitoxin system YoeB family toxin [Spirochaetota bacterium]
MRLIWNNRFVSIYKKWELRHPNLKPKARNAIAQFEQEPFHPILKTHSLVGELEGFWAFSINYEYRIVFSFTDSSRSEAVLLNIGTHDEVY